MKIEELKPLPKAKVLFKQSSFKQVPNHSGCYILSTFENQILYIGLAENLNKRFNQHIENPEKIKPTNQGKAIWFYYLEYTSTNLEQLERTWLNQYVTCHGKRPVLNKVDSPIR